MISSSETMRAAELALGSSTRLIEQWGFLRRMGWHHYWTPEIATALAARAPSVKSLVWC